MLQPLVWNGPSSIPHNLPRLSIHRAAEQLSIRLDLGLHTKILD